MLLNKPAAQAHPKDVQVSSVRRLPNSPSPDLRQTGITGVPLLIGVTLLLYYELYAGYKKEA